MVHGWTIALYGEMLAEIGLAWALQSLAIFEEEVPAGQHRSLPAALYAGFTGAANSKHTASGFLPATFA
jgi:hypothetical protein